MVSAYEVVEIARKSGKVEKGTNEVTKERYCKICCYS